MTAPLRPDDHGTIWKLVLEAAHSRGTLHETPGHYLLAVLKAGGVGAAALTELGVDVPAMIGDVESALDNGLQQEGGEQDEALTKARHIALKEAVAADRFMAMNDFLLLGILLEGTHVASTILSTAGVQPDALRPILARLSQQAEAEAATAPTPPKPQRQLPPPMEIRDDPTGSAALVTRAFTALVREGLDAHLSDVNEDVTYSDIFRAALGKPAYVRKYCKHIRDYLREHAPEFQVLEVRDTARDVRWVWCGWWIEASPRPGDPVERHWSDLRVAVRGGRIVWVHNPASLPEHRDERWKRCVICRTDLPDDTPELFCADHAQEAVWRRRDLVPAEAISERWSDTLATLRNPPEGLRDEPLPEEFETWVPHGNWVVFWRGYRRRPGDIIALNKNTLEFRKYSEASFEEVNADLDGLVPIRSEALDLAHWGNPEPRDFRKRYDVLHRVLPMRRYWDDMLERGAAIYGLSDPLFGLVSNGARSQGGAWTFEYEAPNASPPVRFSITSTDVASARMQMGRTPTDRPYDAAQDSLWARFEERRTSPGAGESFRLVVGGQEMNGTLGPAGDREGVRFTLANENVMVEGTAHGLSEEQVQQLLLQLVPLNEHQEILGRMDQEQFERARREHPEAFEQAQARAQEEDPDGEVPLTAFEQVHRAKEEILAEYPGAVLLSAEASFEERRFMGPTHLRSKPAPYRWRLSWWGAAASPELSVSQTVLQGRLLDDVFHFGRPGPRRNDNGGHMDVRPLFPIEEGAPRDLIDSDRAMNRLQAAGAREYMDASGAKLAVLALAAEEDGRKLWAARYQRPDDAEYLVLVIDANTGETLLSQRSTLKAAR